MGDIRYAARALARAPVFAAISVLTLALGIGVNAAVFAVANAVLIKRLPYSEPERLIAIQFGIPGSMRPDVSVPSPALRVWIDQSRTLAAAVAYTVSEMPVRLPGGELIRVQVAFVSPGVFSMLGVAGLQAGRSLLSTDTVRGAAPVAVAGHSFWQSRLGASSDLTRLQLGGGLTVVGVLSEQFQFPDVASPDLIMPLVLPSEEAVAAVRVIGRMRPGVSAIDVESELATITQAAARGFPQVVSTRLQEGEQPMVQPLQRHLARDSRSILLLALAVSVLILTIACANVAGLLLARTKFRSRELAIRSALGGTPVQIARLLLTESVVLAAIGGITAAIALAISLAQLQRTLVGVTPQTSAIEMDIRSGLFIAVSALVSAVLCAGIPISRLLGATRRWNSKFGSAAAAKFTGQHAVGRALVIGQVAGATILLIGAVLLLNTLWRLSKADVGFEPRQLLTLRLPAQSPAWPKAREAALNDVLDRIRSLPSVKDAAATTSLPLDGHSFSIPVSVDGKPAAESSTGLDVITPKYFQAMGIRVLRGREFEGRDTSTAGRVAIVNEAFLRWRQLTQDEAVGKRIALANDPEYAAEGSKWSIEIVGVVNSVKDQNPGEAPQPIVYLPFEQAAPQIGWHTAKVVVRTASDPTNSADLVRQAIQSRVPSALIYDARPMEERIASLIAPQRQRAVIFGLFGLTAVLLAAVGLYGLLSHVVSQEMKEFGIRLAIGANPVNLALLILRRSAISVAIGLAAGLGGAQLLTIHLQPLLYGVTVWDPLSYLMAAVVMLLVALLASSIPARRAMLANPLDVLKSD